MQLVPIQAIPNQSFTINLDNNLYGISIKETEGVMSVSIERDNVLIVENNRVPAGAPLLPYRYQEAGNFIFITANFQLPYYTKFNVTQTLVYFSTEELDAFRAGTLVFNPIGGYPLRYKPQGYVLAP